MSAHISLITLGVADVAKATAFYQSLGFEPSRKESQASVSFFQAGPVRDFDEASASDGERFAAFHRDLLERGIYLPPSQYEALFVSTAHGDEEIDLTVAAAAESLSP